MWFTKSKSFWFLCYLNPLMFRSKLRAVVFCITIVTKMSFLCQTIKFGLIGRNLNAILTKRVFCFHLLMSIHNYINEKTRINLIILENDILVCKHLWVLLLLIQINWLKTVRASNFLSLIISQRVAVWFSYRNFGQQESEFLFRLKVHFSVISYIK